MHQEPRGKCEPFICDISTSISTKSLCSVTGVFDLDHLVWRPLRLNETRCTAKDVLCKITILNRFICRTSAARAPFISLHHRVSLNVMFMCMRCPWEQRASAALNSAGYLVDAQQECWQAFSCSERQRCSCCLAQHPLLEYKRHDERTRASFSHNSLSLSVMSMIGKMIIYFTNTSGRDVRLWCSIKQLK